MFHDFCQSVTLVFCQRTHVSHDHHPRGPCCSRARISYDAPCMGAISYQKIFASALIPETALGDYLISTHVRLGKPRWWKEWVKHEGKQIKRDWRLFLEQKRE